jgi:hypothetical protein
MHTSNGWECQTLNELYEIHECLVQELTELNRIIQRLSESPDRNGKLQRKRQRRITVKQHLEDLARIIPIRIVDEAAA